MSNDSSVNDVTNLLTETELRISHSGHTPADVIFIGSINSGHQCTWEEFTVLADHEYDSGYGGAEIPNDLAPKQLMDKFGGKRKESVGVIRLSLIGLLRNDEEKQQNAEENN